MACRWLSLNLLFRIVRCFKCESYEFVLSLLIFGTELWGVGQNSPWSESPGDWGVFGDYVGGTLNPVLALTGIFVSIVLAYTANRADKASILRREMEVRPLARIALGDYKSVIEVKVENAGLGPLLIDSISVYDTHDNSKSSLISWFQDDEFRFITWDEYVGDASGFIISPGKELVLLKITNSPQRENDQTYYRDRIRKKLSNLTITIMYKDVYGNDLPSQTRALEWFGREIFSEKRRDI